MLCKNAADVSSAWPGSNFDNAKNVTLASFPGNTSSFSKGEVGILGQWVA